MNPCGSICRFAATLCSAFGKDRGFRNPELRGRSLPRRSPSGEALKAKGLNRMSQFRVLPGAVAALALAASLAATPAAARDRLSPGAAAALGVLGGLAVGGAIAASQAPVYAAPAPVYVEPEPVYVAPPPPRVIVERCYTERSSEYVPGWGWQTMRRRVCN